MTKVLLTRAKGPQQLGTFTTPHLLEKYAEIIELYYTGDKIGYRRLSKQLGFTPAMFKKIVAKYKPKVGSRDIMVLIQSKLNEFDDGGDYQLKQEKPEE